MRHAGGVSQPEDNGQPPSPDGFGPRGIMTDGRRPDVGDFNPRPPRGGEFAQPGYRHERPPNQRQHRETFDEFEDPNRPMAAHPLFRGLLQELPPRSAPPSQEWLDRWSATARSILELLYSRDPLV